MDLYDDVKIDVVLRILKYYLIFIFIALVCSSIASLLSIPVVFIAGASSSIVGTEVSFLWLFAAMYSALLIILAVYLHWKAGGSPFDDSFEEAYIYLTTKQWADLTYKKAMIFIGYFVLYSLLSYHFFNVGALVIGFFFGNNLGAYCLQSIVYLTVLYIMARVFLYLNLPLRVVFDKYLSKARSRG